MDNDFIKIKNDPFLSTYFHNKSIFDFVKLYVEVDKIIGNNSIGSNILFERLDDIKSLLSSQSSNISSISSNISHSHSHIISSLQSQLDNFSHHFEFSNVSIKNMFDDLQRQLLSGPDSSRIQSILDDFKFKLDNFSDKTINHFDRSALDNLSKLQSSLMSSLDSHPLSLKIDNIDKSISTVFSKHSSLKGREAETILLNILSDVFPDAELIDESKTPHSTDIKLIKHNLPTILIESKNFSSNVPKRDVDKFYLDIQQHNSSGILCNAFSGIATKQHFEIDIIDKNVIVFVCSHKFDPQLFKLASAVIYHIHQQLQDKPDSIPLDQQFYLNLKNEYTYHFQSFKQHLDLIQSNLDSLYNLSFPLLDNFFKRKTIINSTKPFSCSLCGTGCSSQANLTRHFKTTHPSHYTPKPKGRPNKNN